MYWQIIVDRLALGAKINMQKDKKLFEGFKKGDLPIFRVYSWEDCFTYGVSQKFEDFDFRYGKGSAKRITGGGILLHGHDISYSIICSTDMLEEKSVKESYEFLCSFLMEFYRSLGLKPSFAKDLSDIKLQKSSFCQIGFEPYDIIIDGKKIGGNAQKRAKEKLIQHGSIPIRKITHSKGGYSLEDVGIFIDHDEVINKLIKCFEDMWKR